LILRRGATGKGEIKSFGVQLGGLDVRAARRLQLAAETGGAVGLLVGERWRRGDAGNFAAVRMVVMSDGGAARRDRGQCVRLHLWHRRREAGATVVVAFMESAGDVRIRAVLDSDIQAGVRYAAEG